MMKKLICVEEQALSLLKDQIAELVRSAEQLRRQTERQTSLEWIGNEEVYRQLKIAKQTLQAYRSKGILPYSIIEGKVLYRKKDIDDFLNSRTKRPE